MTFRQFSPLNVPEHWQRYWSKYPQGMTILESLFEWVSQVDEMSLNINEWNTYLVEFVKSFDKDLQDTVTKTLIEWQTSGFLDIVISDALQTEIDTVREITNTKASKERLSDIFVNVKDFGAIGDYVEGAQSTDNLPFFNLALNSLGEKGGTIFVPDGVYWFSDRIHVQKSNIHFVLSKNTTLIATTSMTAGDGLITFRGGGVGETDPITDYSVEIFNCSVTGGRIVTTRPNTNGVAFVRTRGIKVSHMSFNVGNKAVTAQWVNEDIYIHDIVIDYAAIHAVTLETHVRNATIKNILIKSGCSTGAVLVSGGTYKAWNINIDNINVIKSIGDGVRLSNVENGKVSNIFLHDIGNRGVTIDNSKDIQLKSITMNNVFASALSLSVISGTLTIDNIVMDTVGTNGTSHAVTFATVTALYLFTNNILKAGTHNFSLVFTNMPNNLGQTKGNIIQKGHGEATRETYYGSLIDFPLAIDDIFGSKKYNYLRV